jgi:nucleoside 2-deoxyribosyltransferase
LLNEHNISLNQYKILRFKRQQKSTIREKRREVASTHKDEQIIIIVPRFFSKPKSDTNPNLVSVMMPFSKDFQEIFNAITAACENVNMICLRADDFWKNSVIIQDIFELIYTSGIVIADFSKRNPNVLYEVGIAHTLGKHVIPIVQNIEDIPFDLHHHRVLTYHDNDEGRQKLTNDLMSRLKTYKEEISSYNMN